MVNINLPVNLDINFFTKLKFDKKSIKEYMFDAASLCSKTLGENPVLCFSGGIDSQVMLECFMLLDKIPDIAVIKFANNFNSHDIKTAYEYAKKYNLKLKEIEIDVLNFLSRENYNYGVKYKSPSPQFNVHYKGFNILKDMGYTGVACGGNVPVQLDDNVWGDNMARNTHNYIKYTELSGFMCIGDFLSFYPNLAWAIGLLTPVSKIIIGLYSTFFVENHLNRLEQTEIRYKDRISGYKNAGFDVIRQERKYHGFEAIEKFLQDKTGDGLTFDRLYRTPLEKVNYKNIPAGVPTFIFKDGVAEKIKSIYSNNVGSCF